MIQLLDDLLTKEQKKELQEQYGDLNFCTIAYNENVKLPILLSEENGASIGEVNSEIQEFKIH